MRPSVQDNCESLPTTPAHGGRRVVSKEDDSVYRDFLLQKASEREAMTNILDADELFGRENTEEPVSGEKPREYIGLPKSKRQLQFLAKK